MPLRITEDCINCGNCLHGCPNTAIYEGGAGWTMGEGTSITGSYVLADGSIVNAGDEMPAYANDTYYICADKCTECQGFYEEPECVSVCPIDCIVEDALHVETRSQLLDKKIKLHR